MNSNTITNTITSDNDSGADMDVARDIEHAEPPTMKIVTKYSREQVADMMNECHIAPSFLLSFRIDFNAYEYVSEHKASVIATKARAEFARDERMKPAPKLRESLNILVDRSGMMAVIKEIAEMKEEHMELVEEARNQLKELKRLRDKIEEAEFDLASAMENLGCEDNDTDDLDNCKSEIDECERLLTGEG